MLAVIDATQYNRLGVKAYLFHHKAFPAGWPFMGLACWFAGKPSTGL
jgi:hypothetical protein